MKKNLSIIRWITSGLLAAAGLVLISGRLNASLSIRLARFLGRQSPNWPGYFRVIGLGLLILASLVACAPFLARALSNLLKGVQRILHKSDSWLSSRLSDRVDLDAPFQLRWPSDFNRFDWLLIGAFLLLALISQLSAWSGSFPNVLLGGDAANIASFAAGRAFPTLFHNDAILGDLRNIGLYVTIHLPITIFLEKILGNFGLAYSVLLFPHIFLQYFSYYLLGRVLFNNRYWALLFCLATSSPLVLGGGELWGAMSDGMPRFTYQVLIPFLMILAISTWREKPKRWPFLMVAAGLLAFVHPVSTPTWAFALWLGFWPILPGLYNLRKKLLEMLKLGLVLALALLPYVSIYLSNKKSGSGTSDYGLVMLILNNYFPDNLLNIPGALIVMYQSTSQFGLLWYGLAGLIITFIVFRTERSRLAQMLTWIAGIAFVSILVPIVEQMIEHTLQVIPLQTELMRGMRYLVPFLFIFWFYPLAQLTARVKKPIAVAVFAIGTITALLWLGMNPPMPFTETPGVLTCWEEGNLICPSHSDYADALSHVQSDTPQNSVFVVFLTNRWSGIEVRYLGLRPMAYAYKDRGQLTFTNLDALKTWYYFLRRENVIYSPNTSPTLEIQELGMMDFAKDARSSYMLTDFVFPPALLASKNMSIIYQNPTYSIIKIFAK